MKQNHEMLCLAVFGMGNAPKLDLLYSEHTFIQVDKFQAPLGC